MLEYVETVFSARSVEELWSVHVAAMAEFGFDRLLYGFTRSRTGHSLGHAEDFLILTNHDPAYMDPFINEGLYMQAPTVRWALHNTGAYSWSRVSEHPERLTDEEQRVLALNREYGIDAGYTISFKDVSVRSKGAIGLIARDGISQSDVDALWRDRGRLIAAMNNVAHLKITSLPFAPRRERLTRRQREVLEWVGEGKTNLDTATIMGLKPGTVEKHLRLARAALNVDTTAQAVLKASFQNQIFVVET